MSRTENRFLQRALICISCLVISIMALGQKAWASCEGDYDCIGMTIDSGDPVLIQMGNEMSGMVASKATQKEGVLVKPTEGPIANVVKVLSKENAGLTIVPSDMLLYTARQSNGNLRLADKRLRFVMSIGRKVVHVIARKDITSMEDLDGKRVAMGPDNTAIWVVSSNLLHLHGAEPSEKIQLKPVPGLIELIKGNLDAVFVVGDAPLPIIANINEMLKSEDLKEYAQDIHMIPITMDSKYTEYKPVVVDYTGFAENTNTVAILPTLVSYDFTHKNTAYFRRRCNELTEIGNTIRDRLQELRETGHKQWSATTWDMEAGNWKRDGCFFKGVEAASNDDELLEILNADQDA